jgi:hypothetical protein
MEHLSTSFFRSFSVGSFKEHRMVSVNVPTEIRTTTDVQQAIDAHTEALSNSNDTQAAAARRVLVVQRALAPVALHGEIDAAITRMDRNARIKDLVSSEPNRLSGERGQIAAKLNDTAPGQREAGMTQALAQLTEARTKLSDLRNKLAGNEKLEDALGEVQGNTAQRRLLEAEAQAGQAVTDLADKE